MSKCLTCEHGKMTFFHDRDRTTGEIKSTPYKVVCGKPSYKKRKYDAKPKQDCPEYEKRQRPGAEEQEKI